MSNNYIKIMKLDEFNTLVIKQEGEDPNFFTTSKDGIIISVPNLSYLLKYMLHAGVISPKLLEGILSEYYER